MFRNILQYILLFFICGIHKIYCQDDHTIVLRHLHVDHISYDSLFLIIEDKANVHFSYFSQILPDKVITFNKTEIILDQLLREIFYNTRIGYNVYANHIVLYEKDEVPQKIRLKGQLLKQKNGSPLPYATIEIKGKHKGTVADINGNFELVIDHQYFNDSILFTSMGYKIRINPVAHFIHESFYKIYLEEKIFEIHGIDVYPDNIVIEELGNRGGIPKGSLYLDTHGQQTAIYIDNKKNKTGSLVGVTYYLSKKGNTDAPIRIHVYNLDTISGKPGEEILPRMVVIKPNSGKGWMYVNLSEFKIIMPKEGLFIGIEGVFPDDYHDFFSSTGNEDNFQDEIEKKHILDKISYGQRIGYNNKGKNVTWHFSITKTWFKIDKKKFNVMIGARVLYRNGKLKKEIL